ncbi:transporter substrate-binding domain-containing protein [Tessaracoccus antarcticus]|uniref:ABC transporter substrate-binding protein n=1 Tax=Tessaracoccus antarcticus TaxID=2479848 RepID=A0A3M0G8H8_9ACTN|nr:transporter substrate-binding domain-containing protein [Tessaracoccus antarcticus]RMB61330.1 ABC transporter substrate-binding protein [Tessaracoccus antarcticus]
MKTFRQHARAAAAALACAVALTACSGSGGGDGDEAKLITKGELVVAMSGEFKPFSHFENNTLTGFDYDIAAAIADEMGLTLKPETASFASLIQGLQSNRYDALIASMTPTDKRKEVVDFTESYYTDGAQYFVKKDSDCEAFDIGSATKVGVANGTTYDQYLKDEGFKGEVVSFESDITALEDTEAGRLDGTITGLLVGLFQIQDAKRDIRACGEPLYTESPAVAVAKGNPLKADIDAALKSIKDNGTYADISNKWFGEDIS